MIVNAKHQMDLVARPDVVMSHGRGSWLYDEAGNEYLDCIQGWAVNVLGHAPLEIADALAHQGSRLLTASPAYYCRPALDVVQLLCRLTGMDQAFLANSGAEANDAAIKLARRWAQQARPGAHTIITTTGSFHGRTLACMAASGKPGWDALFPPMLPGFRKVPFGDVEAVAQAIDPSVCAVMVEPIQGEAGVVMPPPGYLKALRELCDRTGTLLILDEIQTGVARTGAFLRCQAEGVCPDILTLGKGLGGGVPVAALLARGEACAFQRGDHGGTYAGNPLMAACALAVLTAVCEPAFVAANRVTAVHFENTLRRVLHDAPIGVREVRGAGFLWACTLQEDVAAAARDAALDRGLLINAAQPNVLRFMPQLRMSADEIDEFGARLAATLAQLA